MVSALTDTFVHLDASHDPGSERAISSTGVLWLTVYQSFRPYKVLAKYFGYLTFEDALLHFCI